MKGTLYTQGISEIGGCPKMNIDSLKKCKIIPKGGMLVMIWKKGN